MAISFNYGTSSSSLRGLDALVKKLGMLKDETVKKAARAGNNAALSLLVTDLRQAVSAAAVPERVKTAARQTIGKRLSKPSVSGYVGKFGFGVGKPSASKKAKANIRARSGQGGTGAFREKSGVGISAANIHWVVLGTQKRFEGVKQRKDKKTKEWGQAKLTGNPIHATGSLPAFLKGLVSQVVAQSSDAALDVACGKICQVLAADAAK